MALTVEDGTGLAAADSYDSIANIDTYLEKFLTSSEFTTWDALSTANKELHARRGTQAIDCLWGHLLSGDRVRTTQALEFPRWFYSTELYDLSQTVPQAVKDAAALMAHESSIDTDGLVDSIKTGRTTRIKIANAIEKEWDQGGQSSVKTYRLPKSLLRRFFGGRCVNRC